MLELLLLVIGCYAAAALLVHLAFRWERKKLRKHYVLIAYGRQPHMEWYLRSMHAAARWTGNDIRLTVLDRGLTDESKDIVDRWNRGRGKVEMLETEAGGPSELGESYSSNGDGAVHLLWFLQSKGIVSERDYPILVDLQNPEDLSKMPF